MKSVSLTHIKRVGLVNWQNREWWSRRLVRIWSSEYGAFWRPNAQGYTEFGAQAWTIDFLTAYEHTKHCGPEKKINFFSVGIASPSSNGKPATENEG